MTSGAGATLFDLPGSFAEINAHYWERGWTDGLPIMPPTEAAVAEMLSLDRPRPQDIVGGAAAAPGRGHGAKDRDQRGDGGLPAAIPAGRAGRGAGDRRSSRSTRTGCRRPPTPWLRCSSSTVRSQASWDQLGLQLLRPGLPRQRHDRSGDAAGADERRRRPARGAATAPPRARRPSISYCVAENEAANPWEPLHVELGFDREVSTVTAVGAEGPHNIQEHESNSGEGILLTIAGAMGRPAATTCSARQPVADAGAGARGHHRRATATTRRRGQAVHLRACPLSLATAERRVPEVARRSNGSDASDPEARSHHGNGGRPDW